MRNGKWDAAASCLQFSIRWVNSLAISLLVIDGWIIHSRVFARAGLEKQVISRQSERHQQLQLAESPDDLKQSVISRMMSVTNAEEDVCVAILEDHKYDLKASIEAFFQMQ